MMRFLRRHFLTGLVVIAPTAITVYVVWWGFTTIDNLIEPLQKRYPIIDIPGIGFAVVLVLIVITGILASNLIGKRVISLAESLLNLAEIADLRSKRTGLKQAEFADQTGAVRLSKLIPAGGRALRLPVQGIRHVQALDWIDLLAIFNSLGLLEIAIRDGNAAGLLKLNTNSTIRVEFKDG